MRSLYILLLSILILASCQQSPPENIFTEKEKAWLLEKGLWGEVSMQDTVKQRKIKRIIAEEFALQEALSKDLQGLADSLAAKYPEAGIEFDGYVPADTSESYDEKERKRESSFLVATFMLAFGFAGIVFVFTFFIWPYNERVAKNI